MRIVNVVIYIKFRYNGLMNFSNSFLHISLFQKETSGTIGVYFTKHKLEIDVKHALDWKGHGLVLSWKERFAFVPMPFGCQGLRVLLLKRS